MVIGRVRIVRMGLTVRLIYPPQHRHDERGIEARHGNAGDVPGNEEQGGGGHEHAYEDL